MSNKTKFYNFESFILIFTTSNQSDYIMEKTLVLLKPGTIQRALIGEIIQRFESKGLQICGMKMMQLSDELLNEHYAHLVDLPFITV